MRSSSMNTQRTRAAKAGSDYKRHNTAAPKGPFGQGGRLLAMIFSLAAVFSGSIHGAADGAELLAKAVA